MNYYVYGLKRPWTLVCSCLLQLRDSDGIFAGTLPSDLEARQVDVAYLYRASFIGRPLRVGPHCQPKAMLPNQLCTEVLTIRRQTNLTLHT